MSRTSGAEVVAELGPRATFYDLFAQVEFSGGIVGNAMRKSGLHPDREDDLRQEVFLALVEKPIDGDLNDENYRVKAFAQMKVIVERVAVKVRRETQYACTYSHFDWHSSRAGESTRYHYLSEYADSGGFDELATESEIFAESDDRQEDFIGEVDYERLIGVVDQLPPADRQAIRDVLAGESADSAAQRWGVTKRAVLESLRRVVAKMRDD